MKYVSVGRSLLRIPPSEQIRQSSSPSVSVNRESDIIYCTTKTKLLISFREMHSHDIILSVQWEPCTNCQTRTNILHWVPKPSLLAVYHNFKFKFQTLRPVFHIEVVNWYAPYWLGPNFRLFLTINSHVNSVLSYTLWLWEQTVQPATPTVWKEGTPGSGCAPRATLNFSLEASGKGP